MDSLLSVAEAARKHGLDPTFLRNQLAAGEAAHGFDLERFAFRKGGQLVGFTFPDEYVFPVDIDGMGPARENHGRAGPASTESIEGEDSPAFGQPDPPPVRSNAPGQPSTAERASEPVPEWKRDLMQAGTDGAISLIKDSPELAVAGAQAALPKAAVIAVSAMAGKHALDASQAAARANPSGAGEWGRWLRAAASFGGAYLLMDFLVHRDDSLLGRFLDRPQPQNGQNGAQMGKAEQMAILENFRRVTGADDGDDIFSEESLN